MNELLKIFSIGFLLIFVHGNVNETKFEIDPNGYLIFCLCMGRLGNQAEHFLGGLAFAKSLNRTLIVPPWRTYKNVPFSEWFEIEALGSYHRVIEASDFFQHLAREVWPIESRYGFCWSNDEETKVDCQMKEGNPFGPFWDELSVDFVGSIGYHLNFDEDSIIHWQKEFPADRYPVIAMKGAPARFPMERKHRHLQKYLNWSKSIVDQVRQHHKELFNDEPFIGIHLRNDVDWERACADVESYKTRSYMASPQCFDPALSKNPFVSKKICFPPDEEIFRLLKNVVLRTRIHNVYVATDRRTMIKEIEENLSAQRVKVKHLDPWLPIIDVAMLAHSNFFIGNCVSSFTSLVKRARDVHQLPSAFWAVTN